MIFSGAEIIIKSLRAEGVRYLFGYPGGAVLHIYDALESQIDDEQFIEHILVRHEQGAIHAADGYARSTGKVGVALVTSGPGLTNAVTGIATAHMDSIPLVVLAGQVGTAVIGSDAFQEVDTVGITRSCVKHNFLVKDIKNLVYTIKKAFYIAKSGRPGPVVIDIPKDITINTLPEFLYPNKIELRSYQPISQPDMALVKTALDLMLNAKQPIIYSGGGCVIGNASKLLRQFTRNLAFPLLKL